MKTTIKNCHIKLILEIVIVIIMKINNYIIYKMKINDNTYLNND
jgi:hypothetical protein